MTFAQKLRILFTSSELKKITFIFIGVLIMAALEVIGVSSIAPFMAIVTTPELIHQNNYLILAYEFFGADSDNSFILIVGILFVVIMLGSNSLQAFMSWKITFFSQMQTYRLSVRLLQKYLSQPYSFHLNRNTSELSKNIINEVNNGVSGVILNSMRVGARLVITLFLFLLLILLDPVIAFSVSLILSGTYGIVYKVVKSRLRVIGAARLEASFQCFKNVNEALSGIKDVKLRGTEKELAKRFSLPAKAQAHYSAQNTLIASLPRYLLEVIAFGGIISIVISLLETNNHRDIIPVVSIYAMAGYRLLPSLQQIYAGMTAIRYSLPALNVLITDLSDATSDSEQPHQQTITFEDKFKVKDLCFTYPNSKRQVLKKLNLTIKANTTVGIVGSTGSGKTTLIDILLGLLVPESGIISVDDVEINRGNIKGWQPNLGYVSQSIFLTDDSIVRNIAFGIPEDEINLEQVRNAADMANLDDFIKMLPDRYNTFVGERGVRLSGGQSQRIGIARALYYDPTVLVLDEATSSLDGITENTIMDAIHNLSHKKTIIVIAHRLSTVKACDVIHMMSNGQIVESGTYQQLIENNEEFKRMAKV